MGKHYPTLMPPRSVIEDEGRCCDYILQSEPPPLCFHVLRRGIREHLGPVIPSVITFSGAVLPLLDTGTGDGE